MSRRPTPSRHMDVLGRYWQREKLREILADPAVLSLVQDLFCNSHDADAVFNTGACYAAACERYRREEPAALLFLLVIYYRDHARPWPRSLAGGRGPL